MRAGPRVVMLAGLLAAGMPRVAAAEWQFTPFLGQTFKGATTIIDNENAFPQTRWDFGGVVRAVGDGPLGVESLFVYTGGTFQRPALATFPLRIVSSRTFSWMGNAVLTTPLNFNRYGLRPFVSGGLGLIHTASVDERRILPIRLNLPGMNLGGGAVGFVSDRVGLRFDLRYFRNVRGVRDEDLEFPVTLLGEPVRIRFWTASIGVVLKY